MMEEPYLCAKEGVGEVFYIFLTQINSFSPLKSRPLTLTSLTIMPQKLCKKKWLDWAKLWKHFYDEVCDALAECHHGK